MFQRRKYDQYIDYAKEQQRLRLGYPLTGAVYGFFSQGQWVKTNNPQQPLIPQADMRLATDNAATTMMLNIGDASSSQKDEQLRLNNAVYYPEDIENEVINIFARHFQIQESAIKGYVATGGTEGNLASIWWLRNAFDNQAANHTLKIKPLMIASDQSHYSCAKTAQILGIELQKIKSIPNGEIDLLALSEALSARQQSQPNQPIIIWLNGGTTIKGAIDNIVGVKKLTESYAHMRIRIHIDGAILGAALPILRPEAREVFKYADTLSISGHKLLATPLACGIVLAKKEIIELAFANQDTRVGYVHDIHDITITGCRSVLPIFQLHKALDVLDITRDCANLRSLINTCLTNANYLASQLKELVGSENVEHDEQRFTVIFTVLLNDENINTLKDKYTLMPLPDNRVCVTVFANVDKKLIDEFIDNYKQLLSLQNDGKFKFKSKM